MGTHATPATQALDRAGITYTIHDYDTRMGDDTGATYGEAVAAELGFPPERVLKTLVTIVDDAPAVAVVPVSRRLSTKALAKASGTKRAALAEPARAQRLTGYVVGGVSPLGHRRPLPVIVDVSALRYDTVLVNGGRRGIQIELSPADLVAVTGATTAAIAAD